VRRFRVGLGRLFGVEIALHASWFPVFAALVWLASLEFAVAYPSLAPAVRVAMGAATAVLFFSSLVAHEMAHAVVARRRGVPVRGITLFLFGGVAEIGGEARRPGDEFAIALAGPITSVVVAGLFALVTVLATRGDAFAVEGVATVVAVSNLVVALFNLVPGLPLDGGRLLRAGIWRATGDRRRATRIASSAGVIVSILLMGLGVFLVLRGLWAGAWYVVIGWFLGALARRSVLPARPHPPALAFRDGEGQAAEPRS
jgi:Zn-dependent protease